MLWKVIEQNNGAVIAIINNDGKHRPRLGEKLVWEGVASNTEQAFAKAQKECPFPDLVTMTIKEEKEYGASNGRKS